MVKLSRRSRRMVLLTVALSVSGCRMLYFEARGLPRSPRPAKDTVGAVMVGAVTSPDPERHSHAAVTFRFANVDGSRRFRVSSAQPTLFPVRGAEETADPGLESVAGKLFAIPVKAGAYELVSVEIFNQFRKTVAFEPRPRWQIGPDEIVYIGHLEVTNCYSVYVTPEGERRRETTAGGYLAVYDRGDRDIPLLRDAFPDLREAVVASRVIDTDAVVAQASEKLSGRCSYERGEPR